MSRAPPHRALTLTEELERLEQSITLTLQEIDHNFSRAHRIVTSSILPIVEQYAAHSKDVWEGSKFWKQFFESSANVSLSGYEEQPSMQEETEETVTEESSATTHTTLDASESYETPTAQHVSNDSIQDLDLSNLTMSPSHSTPRPPRSRHLQEEQPSPYKTLGKEVDNSFSIDTNDQSRYNDPQTPVKQTSSLIDDVAMTPQHSPQHAEDPMSLPRPTTAQKNSDPLLHRVLDKNYRIQATPMTSARFKAVPTRTPQVGGRGRHAASDMNLDSSPDVAPPQLTANIYDSPVRRTIRSPQKPRTPGVSVLTPKSNKTVGPTAQTRTPGVWDSDDDDIDEVTGMPFGASPPKTMQFHVPQSRLMKTPAREASKQIVDNILASAGVGRAGDYGDDPSEDFEIEIDLSDHELDEHSPSVVRQARLEDDTF